MGGLLYKDFIGIGGKKIVIALIIITAAFLAIRIMLPGADAAYIDDVSEQIENGIVEDGVIYDALLMPFLALLMVVGISFMAMAPGNIVENDQKNRILHNIAALPVSNKTYIASKYVFVLITAYALISINMIWNVLYSTFAGENFASKLAQIISGSSATLVSVGVVIAAIELPFFLSLGVKKANFVKLSILSVLVLLLFGYIMFGNWELFDRMDIGLLLDWAKRNSFYLVLIETVSPALDLALVYLSYRLSVRICANREVEVDD